MVVCQLNNIAVGALPMCALVNNEKLQFAYEPKTKNRKGKMLADEPYLATDAELSKMHMEARQLLHSFNFSSEAAKKAWTETTQFFQQYLD